MAMINLCWEIPMDEQTLHALIGHVKAGRLSRRTFVQTMISLGLTGPLAAQLLAPGASRAQPRATGFTPTRRGGGGLVRLLYWAAPTSLNPHIALGPNDFEASEIFYEPLADIATDGTIVPVLATEVPSVDNGGVARDGTWVIWRLKPGVLWHDGRPFTADDVIFTWEYAADPATTTTTAGSYRNIVRIERLSEQEVKLVFRGPTPFWADAFCSNAGMILPRHVFAPYSGARSREAPANLAPIGTGPYRFVEFRPRDLLRAEINPAYHVPNRPFFDMLELKGGGDAASAARAVLQTGEYDYAWGVAIEDDILRRMEEGGKGRVIRGRTANPVHIQLNQTDPWTEVDGERASVTTVHPFLTDPAARARRYPGQGREAPQDALSDPDGYVLPEDPVYRQAGLRAGRDRSRAEVRGRLRVPKLGSRQPRHRGALLRRSPVAQQDPATPGPASLHARVLFLGGGAEGEQVDRPKHRPVAERRVRPALAYGRTRDGSGK